MKKYLISGLIILLPGALTIALLVFLFDLLTDPFVSYMNAYLPIDLPEWSLPAISRTLSFVCLGLFILFLGFITELFLVKMFMRWGNAIITRIPFIKTIYTVSKDIISAIFSLDGKKAFHRPVMFPFPNKPNLAVGFESGAVAPKIQEKIPEPLTAVFCPTAPHPISGFLFLVPKKEIRAIDMTNEKALKFLVSCGMIRPESPEKDHDYF